jgi:hypothetical protein
MHPYLQSKLQLPAEELFSRGGCHIYARALKRHFPSFELRRAGDPLSTQDTPKGIHVYCFLVGMLIDVSRIILELEYLEERNYASWPCSTKELFRVHQTGDKGPLNRWRHYLDEDFVSRADSIADAHIRGRSEQIRAALQTVCGPDS